MAAYPLSWTVVLPVKRLAVAKTRLADGPVREALALAVALDTASGALGCARVADVLAVCDDPVAGPALAALGAHVVADQPDAGLNPALAHGASIAARTWPGRGVAALSADLPALRPAELAAALDAAATPARAFLPDAAGAGTTLLAAAPGVALRPAFGPDSARAHRESGAHELTGPAFESLRRDVDTVEDLRAATRLGVGARTAALLAGVRADVRADVRLAPVQATVRTFDPQTRSGTVLLDDGVELAYPPGALDPAVRLLRFGQRVFVRVDEGAEPKVSFLTLATLPPR